MPKVLSIYRFQLMMLFALLACYSTPYAQLTTKSIEEFSEELYVLQSTLEIIEGEENYEEVDTLLKQFPESILLTFSVSQDQRQSEAIAMNWLRNYWQNQLIYSEEGEPDSAQTIANLIRTIESQTLMFESMGDFNINRDSMMKGMDKILEDYQFEEEKKRRKSGNETLARILDFLNTNMNGIIMTCLLGGFIYFLYRINAYVNFSKAPEKEISIGFEGLVQERDPHNAMDMKMLAEKFLKVGDFNQAVRYYYLSFILKLHEDSILKYHPSYTNWEYQRLLQKKNFPRESLFNVTLIFDQAMYGNKNVNRTRFDKFYSDMEKCFSVMLRAKE